MNELVGLYILFSFGWLVYFSANALKGARTVDKIFVISSLVATAILYYGIMSR